MASVSPSRWADVTGTLASGLCALHCAALGAVPGLAAAAGLPFLENVWFETGMVVLALSVGLYAAVQGARCEHTEQAVPFFLAGGIALSSGLMVDLVAGHGSLELVGAVLAIGGGLSMVAGHIANIRCDGVHA